MSAATRWVLAGLALFRRVVRPIRGKSRKTKAHLLPVRKSDVGGTWLIGDTCLGFLLDVREGAGRSEVRRLVARRLVARRPLARRPAAWRPAGECASRIRGRSDPRRRRNDCARKGYGPGAGRKTPLHGRRDVRVTLCHVSTERLVTSRRNSFMEIRIHSLNYRKSAVGTLSRAQDRHRTPYRMTGYQER